MWSKIPQQLNYYNHIFSNIAAEKAKINIDNYVALLTVAYRMMVL